jgi:hypothetical protein
MRNGPTAKWVYDLRHGGCVVDAPVSVPCISVYGYTVVDNPASSEPTWQTPSRLPRGLQNCKCIDGLLA